MNYLKRFGSLLPTVICLAGLTRADCVSDSNWNFGLVGTDTYYVAVPTDGQIYVFAINQCLDMFNRKCVPCTSITYHQFFYDFSTVGKCIVTSIPGGPRKHADDIIETMIETSEQPGHTDDSFNDPTPLVSQALPVGHIIWSLKCGIELAGS